MMMVMIIITMMIKITADAAVVGWEAAHLRRGRRGSLVS
jgi:hypothetical protein